MAKHTIDWKIDVGKIVQIVLLFILVIMGYVEWEETQDIQDQIQELRTESSRIEEDSLKRDNYIATEIYENLQIQTIEPVPYLEYEQNR